MCARTLVRRAVRFPPCYFPALVRRILTRVPEHDLGLRPPDASVLDTYVTTAPSPQNAVDLFEGTWSSKLPLDGVTAGPIPLFSDDPVEWALRHFGDLTGRKRTWAWARWRPATRPSC